MPPVGVEYWTFRADDRRRDADVADPAGRHAASPAGAGSSAPSWFERAALLGVVLPIIANWCGWIFTEVGRQPWVVFGLLKTSQANSPDVSAPSSIAITLAGYIVIYGVLIAVGGWLMWREVKHGPDDPRSGRRSRRRPSQTNPTSSSPTERTRSTRHAH